MYNYMIFVLELQFLVEMAESCNNKSSVHVIRKSALGVEIGVKEYHQQPQPDDQTCKEWLAD